MQEWTLEYDEFVAEQQGLREALCTLGNGYFCVRGAFPWAEPDDENYPGTYIAGGYNRLITPIAGRDIVNEDLVNFPNPLALSFRIDGGDWFQVKGSDIESFRQDLDIKTGILSVSLQVGDAKGRKSRVTSRRFVHMANPHLCGVEVTVTPENWSGRVEVRSTLDGGIINAGVKRYRELNSKHLDPLEASTTKGERSGDEIARLVVETNQSKVRVGEAARTRLWLDGKRLSTAGSADAGNGRVHMVFGADVGQGQELAVQKIASLFSSRDVAIAEPGLSAHQAVDDAPDFDTLVETHAREWARLWGRFDISIEGEDVVESQMILRLHIFHLLQTLSHNSIDLDIGVPARGWHGEAYRGHVFWDELFILPFLNLRLPQIAGATLRYRYNRLEKARQAARDSKLEGAMFPWQSGSDGVEESQVVHLNPVSGRWVPDHTYIQRHVSLAIAYNAWQHYSVTGQKSFLEIRGAEMILEIARFFSSIATYVAERDDYEIHGVMGPDEYHDAYPGTDAPGLNNNAYTNVMVAWLMTTALEALDTLDPSRRQELIDKLTITDEELKRWDAMSHKMFVPFHGDGIISQFEGYEKLKEFDWDAYTEKYGDIHRLDRILEAEGDHANNYQVSKQADALMLFYLFSLPTLAKLMKRLGYELTQEMWNRNLDYYLARTSNGSTLSYLVHSWVMARTRPEEAWNSFTHALTSDVADVQGGTTQEGIHLGAMAGTVDLVQRCFTGLDLRDGEVHFDPMLPDRISRMRLRLRYLGHWINVELTHESIKVEVDDAWAQPVPIHVGDLRHVVQPGETHVFQLSA